MIEDIVNQLRDRAYSGVGVDRLCEAAADEIVRLRLTDAEREAVAAAIGWCDDRDTKTITTLRGLLERLK